MLDIIDIRRNQVMMKGEFPIPLQTAFRGMERARNPWGIGRDQRMAWAEGLAVKTVEENPDADVLYWVGCAASYDPQAQRTARALVELLNLAKVDFAVLGKQESCTGDSARRAGNEYLYTQLAGENIRTLNRVNPKLIVATCPHCMNAIGNEYRQLGGNYQVVHHTEYLAQLVAEGRLKRKRRRGPLPITIPVISAVTMASMTRRAMCCVLLPESLSSWSGIARSLSAAERVARSFGKRKSRAVNGSLTTATGRWSAPSVRRRDRRCSPSPVLSAKACWRARRARELISK